MMIMLLILDYVFNIVAVLATALILGAICFGWISYVFSDELAEKGIQIPARIFIIAMIVGLLLAAIPCKKMVFGVIAADYFATNTEIETLPSKAVDALNKYLDEYLAEPKKGD